MNLTEKISWNNLHIYFFYLFLFSIPFQTRKVFLTEYSFYSGSFTEYATFFVYASDILLILTLIFWLVFNKKLYSKITVLIHILDSRRSLSRILLRDGNDKISIFQKFFNINKLSSVWPLLLVFIVWLIISSIIISDYIEISVFYTLKFIELSLLVIYVYFNLRSKDKLITALFTISFAGFFQGLIAIYQFMYQCPLFKHPFLQKLTGESTVYPQLPGIAKIVVDNEKFVRAYGTFPHPNILGGFLIVSILISTYLLLKHKSYVLSRLSLRYNTIDNNKSQVKTCSLLLSLSWIILIFTQITALFFTFSRTAWIGFLISLFLIVIFYIYRFKIVSRETIIKNCYSTNRNNLSIDKQIFKNSPLERGRLRSRRGVYEESQDHNLKLNKIVSRETICLNKIIKNILNSNIAKFVKVRLKFVLNLPKGNHDKFSVFATLRPFYKLKINSAQGDSAIISHKSNKKIVSRETISENLNNKRSVFSTNNLIFPVSVKEQSCYCRLFYRFKELFIIILLTLILITIYFPQINSRINEEVSVNNSLSSDYLPSNYAFNDRTFYNNVSRETISENFIFGSGPGTFIFQINNYLTKNNINQKLEPWQYQPAHNLYLLIISEIGIVGFIIFTLFVIKIISCNFRIIKKSLNKCFYLTNNSNNTSIVSRETIIKNCYSTNRNNLSIDKQIFKNSPLERGRLRSRRGVYEESQDHNLKLNKIVSRETISKNLSPDLNYYLLAIFTSFLFIGFFDHYFWTLQQGRLIFWLILGLMLVNGKNK